MLSYDVLANTRLSSFLFFLILFQLTACDYIWQTKNLETTCPSRPTKILSPQRIKNIKLSANNPMNVTIDSTADESGGIVFSAKATQELEVNQQILGCYFLFAPDGTLINLESNKYSLPIDGKYIIQAESKNLSISLLISPTFKERQSLQNREESEKLTLEVEKLLSSSSESNQILHKKKVLEDLTRAIRLNPNNGYAYFLRAMSYYKLQQYSKAEYDFNKTIGLGVERIDAYYYRGFSKFKQGKKRQAIEDLTRIIAAPLGNISEEVSETTVSLKGKAQAFFFRGEAYLGLGEYRKAISDYTEATKINSPIVGAAFYKRGLCFSRLGQQEDAIEDYKSALNVGYDKPEVNQELAKSEQIVNRQARQASKGTVYVNKPGAPETYRKVYIKNNCSDKLTIALHIQTSLNGWETIGFWNFNIGEGKYLLAGGRQLQSISSKVYLFAMSDGNIISREDTIRYYEGEKLPMQEFEMNVDEDGDYVLTLTCN